MSKEKIKEKERLLESISSDIEEFKKLPEDVRAEREVAKAAFSVVGAAVWFSTGGLTKEED